MIDAPRPTALTSVAGGGRRVLLIDDDARFRALTAEGLVASGYHPFELASATDALDVLAGQPFDVVLLDIMMPDVDGFSLLQQMRSNGHDQPVIFVTARESVEERVRGLRDGADDYIIKPFAFAELLARIDAVLRRRLSIPLLRYQELDLDPSARRASFGSRRIDLSPKEFELLHALMRRPGTVLSRRTLAHDVWNMRHEPNTNVVEVHIARLRRKLEHVGCHLLQTVRGEGYRLGTTAT